MGVLVGDRSRAPRTSAGEGGERAGLSRGEVEPALRRAPSGPLAPDPERPPAMGGCALIQPAAARRKRPRQNGLRTTRRAISTRRAVGTSLTIRENRAVRAVRASAEAP